MIHWTLFTSAAGALAFYIAVPGALGGLLAWIAAGICLAFLAIDDTS